MHSDPIENTLELYEMLVEKLINLITNELAESQENKEEFSDSFRLGKMTAYSKILALITTEQKKIQKQWDNIINQYQ